MGTIFSKRFGKQSRESLEDDEITFEDDFIPSRLIQFDDGIIDLLRFTINSLLILLSCSFQGDILIGGGFTNIVQVDSTSGAVEEEFIGHTKSVSTLLNHPSDPNLFFSASRDLNIHLWSSTSPSTPLLSMSGHDYLITGLAWGEGLLFSGSRDTSVRGWDVEMGVEVMKGSATRNLVTCLSTMPSDPHLVIQGGEDLQVRVWDSREGLGSPSLSLKGFTYFPLSLATANDTTIVTGSKGINGEGGEIRVWDLRKGDKEVFQLDGHSLDVTGLEWMEVGSKILSCSNDSSIKTWDTVQGTSLTTLSPPEAPLFSSVCFGGGEGGWVFGDFLGNVWRYSIEEIEGR